MEKILIIVSCSACVISLVTAIAVFCVLSAVKKSDSSDRQTERFEKSLSLSKQEINTQLQSSAAHLSQTLTASEKLVFEQQDRKIEDLKKSLADSIDVMRKTLDSSIASLDKRMTEMASLQEKNAQGLRETVSSSLKEIGQSNEKSLSEIKASVDEKLQKTLEDNISRSFKEVSERLQEVYKGLGEMQTLANGVGDLKKVLSNVKTRGILGEIQLGAILEDILSPDQYETNVATVKGSDNRVEFAVKLPGESDGAGVYLPIDSKFPADAYAALQDAYDTADAEKVKECKALLEARIKAFAKDIKTKYISVPDTTDFGIMFLPTEGLYAEVVRMGMVDVLRKEYKVNIAGPTTMAALLNSLQTGFRTLAIQKRSGEVWEILGAVKTEFDTFENVLNDIKRRLDLAGKGLDDLVGTRTRAMRRKLRSVEALPAERSRELIGDDYGEN